MSKFQYSSGLPGFGTKGTDGSIGLSGLGLYFSAYDGNTDSISIKSKIVANKILFPADESLPGYPDRVYQTGDEFIDKNGKVFQIDFAELNLYKGTGQQLNTSGFFELGPNTVATPIYTRYSNAFTTSKFLIDVVYSGSTIGNYTSNPSRTDGSIYGIGAVDFAQVKYVDNAVGSYHPYTVYTNSNDVTKPEKAIALVKENNKDVWHLGNLDGGGNVRDVSLFLDFKNVFVPGYFYATSLSTTNMLLSGWLNVNSDVSINGKTYINNDVSISSSLSIGSNLRVINSLNVTGNVIVNNDVSLNSNLVIQNRIKTNLFTSLSDSSILGNLYHGNNYVTGTTTEYTSSYGLLKTSNKAVAASNPLIITTGDSTGDSPYSSGYLIIKTGDGGTCYSNNGGNGGVLRIYGGMGGGTEDTGYTGGLGGDVSIGAGKGGYNNGGTVAGDGGNVYICGGEGGESVTGGNMGGSPGDVVLQGGKGGLGTEPWYSTAGGDVIILPGKDSDGLYGNPGHIYIGVSSGTGGQVRFGNGSAGSPAISFANDTNSGFYRDTADRISVATGGAENFRFDGTVFYARGGVAPWPSDIRLKKDIKQLNNSLKKVLKLKGVSFNYKDPLLEGKRIGFIAQEVEEIFPEIITNTNIIGKPDDEKYKGIRYVELIPCLTEAIKEQQNIINEQQKQINNLYEEIKNIKLLLTK